MSKSSQHYVAQKLQDHQRREARAYACPICLDQPEFHQETRLWEHARNVHADYLGPGGLDGDGAGRRRFRDEALHKAKQKNTRKVDTSAESPWKAPSDDSMILNIGEDAKSALPMKRPTSSSRLSTGPGGIQGTSRIQSDSSADLASADAQRLPSMISAVSQSNPLKRAAGGDLTNVEASVGAGSTATGNKSSRTRRTKAVSGDASTFKDPDFDRKSLPIGRFEESRVEPGSAKKLFDPSTDKPAGNTLYRSNLQNVNVPRRMHDSRTHVFRSRKVSTDTQDDLLLPSSERKGPPGSEQSKQPQKLRAREQSPSGEPGDTHAIDESPLVQDVSSQAAPDLEPSILLQPETRPISHEQLVVEVKGIYAGLVMVEAKCTDVDERQAIAAQEQDPAKRVKLSNEQWQALIQLHKTLLHEHYDFILASHHPSASVALTRLAARYSMPARMWRHGIHAFLEVMRHRLPESLDHMLAFIYIAYSMMALLYETVTSFEDTWIECLGDLARYRMAIESDERDREIWTGVAQQWYGKAADSHPSVGRLNHHLAILARPYTIEQLSLYVRSLTSVQPFAISRTSIMSIFKPILEEKSSISNRSTHVETLFIRAHAILFTQQTPAGYYSIVRDFRDGMFDSHIGRITSKFKNQGVFCAISNIGALFEYGILKSERFSRSTLRLAYDEAEASMRSMVEIEQDSNTASDYPLDDTYLSNSPTTVHTLADLDLEDLRVSSMFIARASLIAFVTLTVALRRVGDKNVFPLVHVYLVFLWSLASVENAMVCVEGRIPWAEIVTFLNSHTLAKGATTSKVEIDHFPQGVGRPLPEDYFIRGQIWCLNYFPERWFEDAVVDDEERLLELPSMTAPRIERSVWLGNRIASYEKWIHYDVESKAFSVTRYATDICSAIEHEILDKSSPTIKSERDVSASTTKVEDIPPHMGENVRSATRPPRTARPAEYRSPRILSRPKDEPKQTSEQVPDTAKTSIKAEDTIMSDAPEVKVEPINPDTHSWLDGTLGQSKQSPETKSKLVEFNEKDRLVDHLQSGPFRDLSIDQLDEDRK